MDWFYQISLLVRASIEYQCKATRKLAQQAQALRAPEQTIKPPLTFINFFSFFQVNNLREIQALRRLSPHQHIITLEEVLYDQPTGRLALVFELMDANLYELIRGRRHYLNANLVRSYMFQLVRALHHMHRKGIFQ